MSVLRLLAGMDRQAAKAAAGELLRLLEAAGGDAAPGAAPAAFAAPGGASAAGQARPFPGTAGRQARLSVPAEWAPFGGDAAPAGPGDRFYPMDWFDGPGAVDAAVGRAPGTRARSSAAETSAEAEFRQSALEAAAEAAAGTGAAGSGAAAAAAEAKIAGRFPAGTDPVGRGFDAEAISEAFRRDSRRYDCGFGGRSL